MKNAIEKVVIIHFGRVGSTVLSELLNQTPELFSAGEIYNNNVNEYIENKGKLWYEIYPNYIEFMENYYQETQLQNPTFLENKKYYIFEYKPYMQGCEIEYEKVIQDFNKVGIEKFVFLYRKNFLRRLVSSMISFETGVWHIQELSKKIHQVYINVNNIENTYIRDDHNNKNLCEAIRLYDNYVNEIKKYIQLNKGICLSFEYDIAENPCKGYQKICDFLGVQSIDNPVISYKRQNPYSLKEIIVNFEEVKNYLKDNDFLHLVQE
jgi:LPS sulfotransferase NodH